MEFEESNLKRTQTSQTEFGVTLRRILAHLNTYIFHSVSNMHQMQINFLIRLVAINKAAGFFLEETYPV